MYVYCIGILDLILIILFGDCFILELKKKRSYNNEILIFFFIMFFYYLKKNFVKMDWFWINDFFMFIVIFLIYILD